MQNDCIDLLSQSWTNKVTSKSKSPLRKKKIHLTVKIRDACLNRGDKTDYKKTKKEKIEINFMTSGISYLDNKFLKSNYINSW